MRFSHFPNRFSKSILVIRSFDFLWWQSGFFITRWRVNPIAFPNSIVTFATPQLQQLSTVFELIHIWVSLSTAEQWNTFNKTSSWSSEMVLTENVISKLTTTSKIGRHRMIFSNWVVARRTTEQNWENVDSNWTRFYGWNHWRKTFTAIQKPVISHVNE